MSRTPRAHASRLLASSCARGLALLTMACLALLCVSASALALAPAPAGRGVRPNPLQALLGSSELWSTIDLCSPPGQPGWVGVRGSMPGDGHARDRLYMSFRLQYLNIVENRWVNVATASTSYVEVGSGAATRQGGTSFELARKHAPYTLRGVVSFQWRRGAGVLLSASRVTSASHRDVSGADPADFSAASCVIA